MHVVAAYGILGLFLSVGPLAFQSARDKVAEMSRATTQAQSQSNSPSKRKLRLILTPSTPDRTKIQKIKQA